MKASSFLSPLYTMGDSALAPLRKRRYCGKSSDLIENFSAMSELSLSPYSDTPTSATSMSADESPTLAAKFFQASCSSP